VPDRGGNAIERMFGRRKDVRRIATRDDRSAVNDLAAVCPPRPSAIGYASGRYWTGQLDHGASRADLGMKLSQSAEAQNVSLGQIEQGWHLA
jgi:hypothetical protein